jgi:hypothetical protein
MNIENNNVNNFQGDLSSNENTKNELLKVGIFFIIL